MADLGMVLSTSTTPSIPSRRAARWRSRALAVAIAIVAALVVWLIAHPLLGVDFTISMAGSTQTMEIGWGSVLLVSLVTSLAGWGLLAVLERLTPRARIVWTVIASVMLPLSFAGPLFAASDASSGAKISLVLMHVVVAAVLIPLLSRTSTGQTDAAQRGQVGN